MKTESAPRSIQRRGLMAAAWAAVAGLVVKYTAKPLEAAAPFQYADTTTTVTNTSVGPTVILANDVTYTSTGSVITGQVIASGARAGVQGTAGLRGASAVVCGVYGESGRGAGSAGVFAYGNGSSTGLQATSDSGTPILGQVRPTSNSNAVAVYGVNSSSFAGGAPGGGGFGVYGISAKGHGLVGAVGTAGAAAVVGATNGVANAFAGAFYGPVLVGGAFTVVGGPKSAAVPHPDGSHRRLYCMESPESWFEDFGTGRLECGRAEVAIDPDFAAMVNLDDYHVFLTEYDTEALLRVRNRAKTGFTVEADTDFAKLKGKREADLDGAFSWRIVAKRKDIAGTRLEPVTIPKAPTLPPLPPEIPPSGARQ